MQSPDSPGQRNSQSVCWDMVTPSSVSLDVINVPSGFLGRWNSSVQAILNAALAGVIVPMNWMTTDGGAV